MIQLYHGDGKGKTTASVGAAVRAAGRGRKILFAQFLKGQETGEVGILGGMAQVQVLRSGRDFPFFSGMTETEKRELTDIHNRILEQILSALQERRADFIVLDEITHACRFGLLDEKKLEQILAYGKCQETEIILTGREPSERLLQISDYSSEIRCIRHPYRDGIPARIGVEL